MRILDMTKNRKAPSIKYACITSYSTKSFLSMGFNQINSFLEYWPEAVKLIVLVDPGVDLPKISRDNNWDSNRVALRDLDCQRLNEFKAQHKKSSYNGIQHLTSTNHKNFFKKIQSFKFKHYSFLQDAVRFSHKVFAIREGLKDIDVEMAFWLDGDVFTHTKIDDAFFQHFRQKSIIGYFLGRSKPNYSETGFHAFNIKHPLFQKFLSDWESYYLDGTFSDLENWTDCHTYDATRHSMGNKFFKNISHVDCGHPLVNCFVGDYLDHLKGGRKTEGKSRRADRVLYDYHPYWNNDQITKTEL